MENRETLELVLLVFEITIIASAIFYFIYTMITVVPKTLEEIYGGHISERDAYLVSEMLDKAIQVDNDDHMIFMDSRLFFAVKKKRTWISWCVQGGGVVYRWHWLSTRLDRRLRELKAERAKSLATSVKSKKNSLYTEQR